MKCRKIVVDEAIPFLKGILEPYSEVVYLPGEEIARPVLKNADALLVRTRTFCNKALLAGTAVRFIGTATIGTDHLDSDYLEHAGIKWVAAPGCNAGSVCQYILAALFEISSRSGKPLNALTLGIAGAGHIGSRVAEVARALGMNVLLCDPPRARNEGAPGFHSFETLVRNSDILTFHVPLTRSGEDSTFHLAGESFFENGKSGMWLINSSRGSVVDNALLTRALASGKMAGAVLDVWEGEPEISETLLSLVSIATPHIAGYSLDGKANATTQMIRKWAAFFGVPELASYRVELPAPAMDLPPDFDRLPLLRVLEMLYRKSYDILKDDAFLRSAPGNFEEIRKNYRSELRREPEPGILIRLGFTSFREK